MSIRLSEDEFCRAVEEVLASLPKQFLPWLENTTVEVQRYPDRHWQRRLGVPPKHRGVMGLFDGCAVTDQEYGVRPPNRIYLFQRAIESASRSAEEVRYEIRRTVLHELAHHFGYSEEDLEDFESRQSPFR
jgi:predicted Zn-dependent protease with MMP-like domain